MIFKFKMNSRQDEPKNKIFLWQVYDNILNNILHSLFTFQFLHYDSKFSVSTWPCHELPSYLVRHHFWVRLWLHFWMRLTFDSVDLEKQIVLPSVGEDFHICWRAVKTKRWREKEFTLCFTVGSDTLVFPALRFLVLRPSDLYWNYTADSWVSSFLPADRGTSQPS